MAMLAPALDRVTNKLPSPSKLKPNSISACSILTSRLTSRQASVMGRQERSRKGLILSKIEKLRDFA
jgi:hypothetical protein